VRDDHETAESFGTLFFFLLFRTCEISRVFVSSRERAARFP